MSAASSMLAVVCVLQYASCGLLQLPTYPPTPAHYRMRRALAAAWAGRRATRARCWRRCASAAGSCSPTTSTSRSHTPVGGGWAGGGGRHRCKGLGLRSMTSPCSTRVALWYAPVCMHACGVLRWYNGSLRSPLCPYILPMCASLALPPAPLLPSPVQACATATCTPSMVTGVTPSTPWCPGE